MDFTKNKIFVSIILPVYNGEAFLYEAINSVLNQRYSNFELIIIDDCSTDKSLDIAKEFAKNDIRIIVVSNDENKKLPANLNIGHHKAKGDVITWTSDDNILKPNFLQCLIDSLIRNNADVVYSNYDIIDEDGCLKRMHITGPTEHILYGNKIGASFLYKMKVFEELNGYDETLFLLEDYDFWLRASVKFNFYHVDDNLYQYRLHSKSLTSNIRINEEKKIQHRQGVIKMFQKITELFSWYTTTSDLLEDNLLGQSIDISTYLKVSDIIKKDILKFNPNKFDEAQVVFGLKLLLRNQLITNNCNFKTLLEVIKNDRSLLFHNSFSKRTTFKYILNSLFH